MRTKYELALDSGVGTVETNHHRRDTSSWATLSRSLLDQTEAWREHAACIDEPDWVFFPEGEMPFGKSWHQAHRRVREVCNGCPVRAECYEYGRQINEELDGVFGVWGGVSYTRGKPNGNPLV